ncbi:BglG family transcription antiterminator [Lysinibacillus piscis]|uniref:Transcriptional antiterminator n=1 Tax=Lysinibacillus piscis TaxID=2518931 RepID=A0ABQ5NFN9_9BACI|nr:HTH domain-containing protein [Lysinibacillus sp. KH24]GLC86928.1 transcriptional antiterminator [Lysinibacillus sp. KH24]
MLNERELKIAIKLLEAKLPMKIKDLSQDFAVSTRTIKYDLEHVKEWFQHQQIDVYSQPNKGLWVTCNDISRDEALQQLLGDERWRQSPDQNVRLQRILVTLLLSNDYIIANTLAENLQVSRNTILNDMNCVSEYIAPWMIQLERTKRKGYKLIGEELTLRLFLEHLIYTNLTNYEIYQIMTRITADEEEHEQQFLMDATLLSMFKIAERHLKNLYTSATAKLFHQSDLILLLIRITISVVRLDKGQTMKGYRLVNKKLYTDDTSLFILSWMENVLTELELPLLQNEFLYLSGDIAKGTRGIDLTVVTNQLVQYVSAKEGIEYGKDPKLFNSLFAHLSLRLNKGVFNVSEINPFADEIKTNYPELFQNITEACRVYLGLPSIINHDAFISLIALHFLSSFENTFSTKRKVRGLYVCATGGGVARLIKNRVEKDIHDIEIVAYCSIMEVEELCQREKVDLIISVFPIQSQIPVIVVEAIPTKRDVETIREHVKALSQESYSYQYNLPYENQCLLIEDNEQINLEIILKGFEIFHEIITVFPQDIQEERKQALQLHIFLMVHRSYFDKQYDDFLYTNQPISEKHRRDLQTLKDILTRLHVPVQQSELMALLQYLK